MKEEKSMKEFTMDELIQIIDVFSNLIQEMLFAACGEPDPFDNLGVEDMDAIDFDKNEEEAL